MNDIEQIYTIQWVGPFHSLLERNNYFKKGKQGKMCEPALFSFYYFRGNKKGRGHTSKKFYDYFGIHKHYDLASRLNKNHEHFRNFYENANLDIWIGAFANARDQMPQNIEDVETVFISTYKPTENKRKKIMSYSILFVS